MMHYFSNGCAGQYKNCKNFLKMYEVIRRYKYRQISMRWGSWGTLKRLPAASRHSQTAKLAFEYCKDQVKGVHVCFISAEDMVPVRNMLEKRFHSVHTLHGTRGFHRFFPLSENVIAAKRV